MITEVLEAKHARQFEDLVTNAGVANPIWGYIWYFVGLPLLIGVASLITWDRLIMPNEALPMTIMVVGLYIGVWANKYQSAEHRSYRAIGLSVFYTTIGFLAIFSLLAMFRQYYSRSFLMAAYGLTILWSTAGMLFFRKRHLDYIIVEGGLANKLKAYKKLGWSYVDSSNLNGNSVDFDSIVVDLHAHDDSDLIKRIADSSLYGVSVKHAASVLERYSGRTNLDYLAEEGLYSLNKEKAYRVFKRVWEVSLIVLFSPVIFLLCAIASIAIKLDSKGPVFFTQQRVGKSGKLFILYKFRSMRTDAEAEGSQFADKKDDRITRLGQFIRKFRIDELPQFWNVLKGDMSLIGPRPEQKDFVEYFDEEIPFYTYRHKVRPGITGWAQVKDGYAASLSATKRKLEYDLYYVKNLSLSLDLLIVYATVKTILTGFGSR